jgi:hypothetical protein
VSKKPEVLEKVLKTMIEGISIFKTTTVRLNLE